MKFAVRRTSLWEDDKPPCANAVLEPVTYIDRRTVDDPAKLKNRLDKEDWYERGSNHRVENGMITRDIPSQDWFVEMEWDDLKEFCELHGRIVLSRYWRNSAYWQIEIYDDYRE